MVIEDIYSFIGNPVIISRGSDYFKNNKVIRFNREIYEEEPGPEDEFEAEFGFRLEEEFTGASVIRASVKGTAGSPYEIEIFLARLLLIINSFMLSVAAFMNDSIWSNKSSP